MCLPSGVDLVTTSAIEFAEQEAAFLSQVAMPMANARDAGAAAKAAEGLTELARLGAALRLSLLRLSIGPAPGS